MKNKEYAHQVLEEFKKNQRPKMTWTFMGIPVTPEHFTFEELLVMMSMQRETYEKRVEDWKFAVGLFSMRP